jgi:hypothetical protein
MTDRWLDHQVGAWNCVREMLGVVAPDDLIIFAIRDGRRRFNCREIFGFEIWFDPPHRAQSIHQLVPALRMRG